MEESGEKVDNIIEKVERRADDDIDDIGRLLLVLDDFIVVCIYNICCVYN